MKTPEEIKKALHMCCQEQTCIGRDCPYEPDCMEDRLQALNMDALEYIMQLEDCIDLMKLQMRGDCGTCKYRLTMFVKNKQNDRCTDCMCGGDDPYHPLWEYEGLPGKVGAS